MKSFIQIWDYLRVNQRDIYACSWRLIPFTPFIIYRPMGSTVGGKKWWDGTPLSLSICFKQLEEPKTCALALTVIKKTTSWNWFHETGPSNKHAWPIPRNKHNRRPCYKWALPTVNVWDFSLGNYIKQPVFFFFI